MDHPVNDHLVYALVDSLEMRLEAGDGEPRLRGEKTFKIDLGGLVVPFAAKVVSALVNRENHMLFLKVKGNLALLLIASESRGLHATVTVHVLNLAKLGATQGWLEKHKPKNDEDLRALLGKAIVKTFVRKGTRRWAAAA